MNQFNSDILEKIREQYDRSPYPRIPLENNPKNKPLSLYYDSLATAFYRRNKTIITSNKDKLILDVACGTGYTTLILAEANPGAKIIAIDISQTSLDVAKERLKYHGHDQVEFHLMYLEDVPQLNLKFDYINAVDILYMLPNVEFSLKQLAKILQPDGIIRGDLHSYHQRYHLYRAQEIFKMMGLTENNPGEMEAELVRDFFRALHDGCLLKEMTWNQYLPKQNDEQHIMMNYLFQGDKGFTVSQMDDDWQQVSIYLHPILHQTDLSEKLSQSNQLSPLFLNDYSPLLTQSLSLDRTVASAIFKPLLDAPQSLANLAQQWLKLRPINLGDFQPTTEKEAWEIIKQVVIEQERWGTILIEKNGVSY